MKSEIRNKKAECKPYRVISPRISNNSSRTKDRIHESLNIKNYQNFSSNELLNFYENNPNEDYNAVFVCSFFYLIITLFKFDLYFRNCLLTLGTRLI